jgi:hypothetical protein
MSSTIDIFSSRMTKSQKIRFRQLIEAHPLILAATEKNPYFIPTESIADAWELKGKHRTSHITRDVTKIMKKTRKIVVGKTHIHWSGKRVFSPPNGIAEVDIREGDMYTGFKYKTEKIDLRNIGGRGHCNILGFYSRSPIRIQKDDLERYKYEVTR